MSAALLVVQQIPEVRKVAQRWLDAARGRQSTALARRTAGGRLARRFRLSKSLDVRTLSTRLPEPVHHDAVEGFGLLDIGEMPRSGDLLVAAAGDQLGDTLVACGRRAL